MDKIYIILFSTLLSSFIGLLVYSYRTFYKEVKEFIKELNQYTRELKQLIVGIQTQIDKSIETDIKEIKGDIKTLYQKTNANQRFNNKNQ